MIHFTGEQLRQIRTHKGIKQAVIARKLGISQPAYCKLEKSLTITEQKWLCLMDALGIEEIEWKRLGTFSPPSVY